MLGIVMPDGHLRNATSVTASWELDLARLCDATCESPPPPPRTLHHIEMPKTFQCLAYVSFEADTFSVRK
jgi:hypothetical protein